MTARPNPLDVAAGRGRLAALAGEPIGSNPYADQRTYPGPALALAWRLGYADGEVEAGELDGDLFRTTPKETS
jgi:hypothetical protein